MSEKSKLDQYYTNPEYAKYLCENLIKPNAPTGALFIEPSAGSGAFSMHFNSRDITSYDLEPKFDGCLEQDFLKTQLVGDFVFIGNPPFGKNSSLAVKFFNHAAKNAKMICFILPKTFQKMKFKNRLDFNFHLLLEEDCPVNSFLLDGEPYDVPCVFQIWVKKEYKRERFMVGANKWFKQCTPSEADLVVRRVGGRAGQVLALSTEWNINSTYFLKSLRPDTEACIVSLKDIITEEASKSAGVRSIGLDELQYLLDLYIN